MKNRLLCRKNTTDSQKEQLCFWHQTKGWTVWACMEAGALTDVWNVLLLAFREENWKDSMAVWGGAEGEEWSVFRRDLVCERKIWKGHAYRSMDKTLCAGVQNTHNNTHCNPKLPKIQALYLKGEPKTSESRKKVLMEWAAGSCNACLGSRENSCLCHQLNWASFLYVCC